MTAVCHYGEGHVKVLRLLMDALSPERRAEAANEPDGNGLTPLFLAQTRGSNPDCLKRLISASSVEVNTSSIENVFFSLPRLPTRSHMTHPKLRRFARPKTKRRGVYVETYKKQRRLPPNRRTCCDDAFELLQHESSFHVLTMTFRNTPTGESLFAPTFHAPLARLN